MTWPRRVLVISYLPPTHGGIATWAGALRRCASNSGYRFLFESVGGIRSGDGLPLGPKALAAVGLIVRLLYRLVVNRPELVHVNCCMSPLGVWRDLLVASMVRACRVPLLVHYRGSLPDVIDRLSRRSRLALHWLMRLASVNVGVTRDSESLLRRFCGGDRAAYLPNFIDDRRPALSSGVPQRQPRECRRTRAAYVGRLSADKGTLDLLQAARLLPEVDFVLMGEITEGIRSAVQAAPANVTATGNLPRAEVLSSLRDVDLFVFPSRREGFPNAVLEAMASGLPVVSTRVGAIPEVVEEGIGGYLVGPSDPNALASAIRRLARDAALSRRMGEQNRFACAEKFGFETVFASLTALYERIASSRRAPRSGSWPFRLFSGLTTVGARGREADP
jgi:glycosyltransferase involved in cell wall biosynthesis